MTITDVAVRKKSYSYLTFKASYPNHDSKAVLDAFDPNQDLQLPVLVPVCILNELSPTTLTTSSLENFEIKFCHESNMTACPMIVLKY